MVTGIGEITPVLDAVALTGNAYDEVAASTVEISRNGADFAVVYPSFTIGDATSATVEVAVSPDDGANYYAVAEQTYTATGTFRIPVEFAPGETKLRIRAKANADGTTAVLSVGLRLSNLKYPIEN